MAGGGVGTFLPSPWVKTRRSNSQTCHQVEVRAGERGGADPYENDPYERMGLDRAGNLTEAEVRAAYRQRVKLVHPDLAGGDPLEVARREALTLALNEAYVSVLRDLQMPPGKREPVVLDVFDRCARAYDNWVGFVNPLEMDGVPHVYWSKLQEVFTVECDSDPLLFEERMRQEGVRVNGETAVRWVTVEQQEELMRVVRALEIEGDVVRVEAEAWWISDCLRRARKANLM